MPKDESMRPWKGQVISQKVYDQRILNAKNGFRVNNLGHNKDFKTAEKVTAEVENAILLNAQRKNSSTTNEIELGIETVYYQNDKEEKTELNPEESTQEKDILEGRRIVDLVELGKQLWCGSCKETLSLTNIEKECRRGYGSLLLVRCHKCLIVNEVSTGKMHALTLDKRAQRFDINTDLAFGKYHYYCFTNMVNLKNASTYLNIQKIF